MSDISDNIIKILNDNGVSVQIENIWGNTGTNPKVVRRNINLDFSEHDKVFEDKIAELKKDYKTASELLCKYQQENESLKKRIIELENFSCQAEQETESLFEKLNQHIAELESKNEQLKFDIDKMATSKSEWIDKAVEWKQKCEKLESKETEICEKEPNTSDSAPSIEWYDNRHQSDCIEINRLNTTIDVLIHKVEYLRQFAGLE